MRLVDADKLKKDVLDLRDCYNGFSDTFDKACIIGVIDEQPTAQPEIIRCEDCKWYDGAECCERNGIFVGFVADTFYCADGEKKE